MVEVAVGKHAARPLAAVPDNDVPDCARIDVALKRFDRTSKPRRRLDRGAQPVGRGVAHPTLAGRLGLRRRVRYGHRGLQNPIERRFKHAATRGEAVIPPSRVGHVGGEVGYPPPRIGDRPGEARIGAGEARIGAGESVEGNLGDFNALLGLGHAGEVPGAREAVGCVLGRHKQVVD